MKERTITFETYPEPYLNYETGEPNPNFESDLLFFTVPYDWYLKYIDKYYSIADLQKFRTHPDDETLDEAFRQEYSWDDTEHMLGVARDDGVVIYEEVLDGLR